MSTTAVELETGPDLNMREPEFLQFMSMQYSSKLFLAGVIVNAAVFLTIFQERSEYTFGDGCLHNFGTLMRYGVLWCPVFVLIVKQEDNKDSIPKSNFDLTGWLPFIQTLYQIMVVSVFSIKILSELPGPNSLAANGKYLPLVGLTLAPFAFFLLFRDMKTDVLLFIWTICVLTLLCLCMASWTLDSFAGLLSYVFVSAIFMYETDRHNKRMVALLTKLQDTLKLNEKLAVEAQALELRAMIGNVAHDLKTVSFYIGTLLCLASINTLSHFVFLFSHTASDLSAEWYRIHERCAGQLGASFHTGPYLSTLSTLSAQGYHPDRSR